MTSNSSLILPGILENAEDIRQVLALQAANWRGHVSSETAAEQGFLTVQHDAETLQKMMEAAPQVLAKAGNELAGYALTMFPALAGLIPDLEPMFQIFEHLEYRKKTIASYRFYVMGQVCVAEKFRGRGVFDLLYEHHRTLFSQQFDFCVTEIATRNTRSMRAHERVGFKTIHTHRDAVDEWNIVLWDWR